MEPIKYPYIAPGRTIKYVLETNEFMSAAKEFAKKHSLDDFMPGAAVVVKDGHIVGLGANGSMHHKIYGCERVKLKCKTGEGYKLCEGCSPKYHSEIQAIESTRKFIKSQKDLNGADLYLWGHFWFCKDCWNKMIEIDIKDTYLLYESNVLFDRTKPGNIVGRQFLI